MRRPRLPGHNQVTHALSEPAGKQDWLEIDPSPVPGGRAKGRPVWLCCLAESSIEAWGSMGKFVFLDLIGCVCGGGGMQRLGRYTPGMWSKSRLFRASQTLEFRVILHLSLQGAGYLLYIAGSEYRSIKPFYSREAGEPSLA